MAQIYSMVQTNIVPPPSSSPSTLTMYPQLNICTECGAAVGDVYAHDDWHDRVAKAAAMKTGKIL